MAKKPKDKVGEEQSIPAEEVDRPASAEARGSCIAPPRKAPGVTGETPGEVVLGSSPRQRKPSHEGDGETRHFMLRSGGIFKCSSERVVKGLIGAL